MSHQIDLIVYYRDFYTWIPGAQRDVNPPFSRCGTTNRIGVDGFCKDNSGRKIIGINNHYLIATRRHTCHHYSENNSLIRKSCTLRACYTKSLEALHNNLHLIFPATSSREIGIDKLLVDMMRSMFDSGLKPERFRNMMHELHHKEDVRLDLTHESKRRSLNAYFVDDQQEKVIFVILRHHEVQHLCS